MVIFNSYVKLPEGTCNKNDDFTQNDCHLTVRFRSKQRTRTYPNESNICLERFLFIHSLVWKSLAGLRLQVFLWRPVDFGRLFHSGYGQETRLQVYRWYQSWSATFIDGIVAPFVSFAMQLVCSLELHLSMLPNLSRSKVRVYSSTKVLSPGSEFSNQIQIQKKLMTCPLGGPIAP